ncbi:hypothetical protein [Sphingorhabdus contaminans]|uniref:hypothetical protein n=1 Tax=Sphingorhabdus contaminans TaxID=1343899 RepID=UPI003D2787B6
MKSSVQSADNSANLYKYIDLIRTRPGMYIGGNSVRLLACHLDGYEAACRWKGVEETLFPPWYDFHEYVRARTGFTESTSGWANMLLKYCGGDEVKALDRFFVMFDAFRSEDRKIYA